MNSPKILIANRGEIALRVIRACNELGLTSVIAYSLPDRESLPVKMADEAVCIGTGPATDSYLRVDRIIAAAELSGAAAIHPGYGFLAENAHFAEICANCRIHFIGPSAKAIRLMGDKTKAREVMSRAGVPVIPGSNGAITTVEEAWRCAKEIGYPIMLKAAAGGGGKGMRRIFSDDTLANDFMSAQAESRANFSSEEMFIEKYIENAKHVEVQLLADSYGNIVSLGDRDCSLQRRHQKMIEEAPCPVLDEATRAAMSEVAIKAAHAVDYTGAGTIEFLLTPEGRFYFMEMNTRIQVEHPVTEEVTGRDLVREQIRIALGERLDFSQQEVKLTGHAIEVRVNAEDVTRGFAPFPGKITLYSPPGGPGIRVDSHLMSGCEIPPYYDSLLGKIIARGATREEALARARRAVGEFWVDGVRTNCRFARHMLDMESFATGQYHTGTLEEEMTRLGEDGLKKLG